MKSWKKILSCILTLVILFQTCIVNGLASGILPAVSFQKPERAGILYQVTLKVKTNGILGDGSGGNLSADVLEGYEGDTITLNPVQNSGYVFSHFESFITETNASTDGLLTITNNQFQLDSKTGNVTIVANYITKPTNPAVIFEDDFSGTLNGHGKYSVRNINNAIVSNGKLSLSATGSAYNYILVPNSEFSVNESVGEGYSIEAILNKGNGTAGTMQIGFRSNNNITERYVLAINGSLALIRYLNEAKGINQEIAKVNYTFDAAPRKLTISIKNRSVSVTSDGIPLISHSFPEGNNAWDIGWDNTAPSAAFINMTNGAPVVIDDILIKRIEEKKPVHINVTMNGNEDTEYLSGTASAIPSEGTAGTQITLSAMAKAGYELKSYSIQGIEQTGDTFIMPTGLAADGVTVTANFITKSMRDGKNYYIDSANGKDSNTGETMEQPWGSISKLENIEFVPGDKILIKAGSVFNGTDAALRFKGSGSAGKEIIISSYGNGNKPQLNGQGELENVVILKNQEYITIEKLEITNLDPGFNSTFELNTSNNKSKLLRAVNVFAEDFGVVHKIHLKELDIHDINGNISSKWNGGIFFDITGTITNGKIMGIPTKYDDILIEGCKFQRVDRSAIKLVSSVWANQSLANNSTIPLNWYPSTNIKVRQNIMRQIGGDGITVRDADGTLIEYNIAGDCRYQSTGYNAGIWPFQASNTVLQYNETYRTRGVQDGQGMDCDHVSSYNVMQYNYSHDNFGGFMLIMNGFPHTAPTVRYNISQNDKDKTFEFSRGTPAGTMIYNNTIYSESILTGRGGVFDVANSGAGTGNREVFVFNNIFYYPDKQKIYCGEAEKNKNKFKLYNNAYFGGIVPPAEEEKAITVDPKLAAVGTGSTSDSRSVPATGRYLNSELDGYKLLEDSPLIDNGVSIDEVVARYGGTITDRRSMSPTEIHALAKVGNSIDFAMGTNFPSISGVNYQKDFFGTSIAGENDKLDIGAMEYQKVEPEPEIKGDTNK